MLKTKAVTLAQANEFIARLHRHHDPVIGHKWSIGAVLPGCTPTINVLVGVACIGRPVARNRDDGCTVEVTRLCTDGTRNACSILYAAAARAAFAIGYDRIGTYILPEEGGASLRASGWEKTGETPGKSWSVPSRPRDDSHPLGVKERWEKFRDAQTRARYVKG